MWWSVGSLLFLVLALRLNAVVQESEARVGPATHDVLKTLSMITTAMWLGYPLMILLGADGVGAIPTKAELGCLTLLDLSAKVRGAFQNQIWFKRDASHTPHAVRRVHIPAVQHGGSGRQSKPQLSVTCD